jgi:hypothetical protein
LSIDPLTGALKFGTLSPNPGSDNTTVGTVVVNANTGAATLTLLSGVAIAFQATNSVTLSDSLATSAAPEQFQLGFVTPPSGDATNEIDVDGSATVGSNVFSISQGTFGNDVIVSGVSNSTTGTPSAYGIDVTNPGTIVVAAGGANSTLTITGNLAGRLAAGGTIRFVGGSGADTIDASGMTSGPAIEVQAGTGAETIRMGPSETLHLDNPFGFTGTVFGFVAGDTIDLAGIGTATSAALGANNVLTVQGGTSTVTLKLDPTQNYEIDNFNVARGANGGTNVTVSQKPGYYVPQPSDGSTPDAIAASIAKALSSGGIRASGGTSISGTTLEQINKVFNDASFTTGGLVHVPISELSVSSGTSYSSSTLLPPLPQGEAYVFNPASQTVYTVGASLDGHDSGDLIVDVPGSNGKFPTFAPGTYSAVGLDANGSPQVTLTDPRLSGLFLGTFDLDPSLKLTDGTVINLPAPNWSTVTDPLPATAAPEQVLLSYLNQLGYTISAAQLDQDNTAFQTQAPPTTTYTFGNGSTITLDQGSYSSAGLSYAYALLGNFTPTAFSATLTTALGETIRTLTLDPTTGAGTLTRFAEGGGTNTRFRTALIT